MNRRQSLEKGILSPSGPFLTPSQSPSIQHSPRSIQPSPSQSPFQQQDVLLVTNNSQHFINTFSTTQEQDRKTGTPNRRLSLNHIQSPNAGTTQIVYRPSPTQSPANLGIVNEINTTLVGSNNISLNKKGKRTPNANQYGTTIPSSNACSPKATKKGASILVGSPIASPSPSASPQPMIQQFPMMNTNNSIVFMQQPATSHRASLITNTQQSNFIASSSNTSNVKQNKAPQQILPKPTSSSIASALSTSASTPSLITSTTSTKQIVTQSKMAIVQQQSAPNQTQQFQSPPHQSTQIISSSGNESPSSQQIAQGGIILPSGAQPLLLNQMPVLVQQNTAQGVQFFIQRPQPTSQLATPSLVIHNRPQMQQSQPQMLRILNANAPMQLATATAAAPAFIVSSQANIIQQNLQSIKTPTNNSNTINQISNLQQNQQQTSRQPQQIITNSHILGQSVAQIQNLQLNGNLTQIQMPNGQIIQQLPAQFSTQNLGSFNQIQPIGSQIATFQSPPQSSNSQGDIVPTSNPIQFTTNQTSQIAMTQGAQIISPVATPQPQIIQSDSILSSPPSIAFNSQPQTVIVTGDKQIHEIHEISSPPPFSIIQQTTTGNAEIINLDLSQQSIQQQQQQQQTSQSIVNAKPARKPKKSKKKQALELAQQQAQMSATITIPSISTPITVNDENNREEMLSPSRNSNNNSQAPTGKLDLANVIKLCGIMEDDDFDSDEQMTESMESQQQQQQQQQQIEQTQTIRAENSSNTTGSDQIMITIPSGTADQPFTFTIPSSSLENVTADGTILHQASNEGGKIGENVPLMIRFDGDTQNGSQPFTISVPNLAEESMNMIEETKQDDGRNSTNPISCVPSFVNQVLNSSVTPTIQSQINEIQNQLMALPPVQQASAITTNTSPTKAAKAPRQRKQTTKKSKKQLQLELQQQQQQQIVEKTIEVPTQIGNIQISQIDGTTMKNTIGNKNINNQIQIMPILDKNQSTSVLMEKQKLQVPIMQQTISQQQQSNQHGSNNNNNSNNNKQQGPPPNSGPSQVNINVQQNQLINVTNNLQMQVIANPQQQHNNATPAPPPPSSSQNNNSSQSQSAQNIIGNIINAQQGQQGGNIIIQGASSFNQQQPTNIQVNIQNQTIANNIITTAPPPVSNNNAQQQPTAQSILSQLTGNLVLSLSEDGRLILRHDPNIPQDAQSQMILQTILTGALGNVSLINEPLKTPAPNQQQTPQHIINANGKIQQISTMQNKNVIITNQPQSQQQQQQPIFNNMMQTQSVQSGQIIHNTSSQPLQVQSTNQQQQQKVISTPNIIKFVELPKIQPNQQLFSLNTLTNEITLLNPNQTTAALNPMERLLIVPSGINAQQLAQCLSQGQIHFNNIGQAPTSDPNKIQQHLQIQQQIQMQQQMTYKTNVQKVVQNIKKEPAETKPKKARGKKAKLLEEQQQQQLLQQVKMEIKKEPIQSPPPMKMITTQAQVSIADTKVIKTLTTTTVATTAISASITNSTAKNTITISPSSNTMAKVNSTSKVNTTKINNKNSISVIPTEILLPNTASSSTVATKVVKGTKAQQIKNIPQQTPPPPLVSVNQAPLPRVQTIQLTPQKQQSLKNVQMQIQQLSGRLQNKNLLATLTADIDLNNPAFSKPLPVLTNIHSMSDTEIYETLQRLFVEQQKILATGKIIPTIPAVSPVTGNQQTVRPNATQSLFVNNQNIVAPISSASTPSGVSLYSGGNCGQKVPSPIQVNSPIVKQESPCSASTTSSQPPPLVVSAPIQMQIKTEILSSPNSGGGNAIISAPITAPPATGSIIISPKYTTSQLSMKITTTSEQLKEQKVPVDSKLDILPAQANEIAIEPSAIIKQQQIAAVELNQKKKVTRSSLFERQICVDQDGCTKADVKTDFTCKEDAVKRLIRYHCMYEEIKDENDPKEDYEFSEQAKLFLASFQAMKEKYQHLLLKQSQQHAPTSELMMLDRLQVADLKDEIVSMQREINSVMQEQQFLEQPVVVKNESSSSFQTKTQVSQAQPPSNVTPTNPVSTQRLYIPMQEPSQILKAKQEQKLFENFKNEISEFPKENRKTFSLMANINSNSSNNLSIIQNAISPKSPLTHHHNQQPQTNQSQKVLSKFDQLKNESINIVQAPPPQTQNINELKDDLDDLDIESEIHSNFIMKKCEPVQPQQQSLPSPPVALKKSKATKEKEKEREFSPLSDYLNSVKMELIPNKNINKMNENVKNEAHDGAYDEWLSIQKELNIHLDTTSCSNSTLKRKDGKNLKMQSTTKALESDLSDIFENHNNSPKSVEKQLDDLFCSTSKTNDLLNASSPPELNELFHVEKTVETRLEALFGEPETENVKSTQQDLVETRLEQLFQSGSVNPNDESALDSASFLYKNSDLIYDEMIEKQVPVTSNANNSNSNKRQWSGNSCGIYSNSNSSIIFPSSPTASKRACTAPSVSFDNKWIEDSFDFGSDIANMATESTSDDIAKHRAWNGGLDHHQFHIQMQTNDSTNLHNTNHSMPAQSQQQQPQQTQQQQQQVMDSSMNYDDVDDISRQVQNAIDSILNLQSSDPLHYQLDPSFLELNAITSPSPNSPVNHQHSQQSSQQQQHSSQNNQSHHHNQYPLHLHQPSTQHEHLVANSFNHSANQQKVTTNLPKRKYSRMDDIGDCLIGGSNLDDSPSALSLTLTDSHGDASTASVGEFVNNLLNCDEKITTS